MAKLQILALGAGLTAGAILAAQAADPAFDVKPGLWQMTTSGKTTGAPPLPPEALARLSPEQRAQITAAVQAAMARADRTHVVKSCVTAAQLQRAPDFAEPRKSCRRTVLKRTATEVAIHEECTGEQRMSGTFDFRALNRETIAGTIDMTVGDGTHTMTMHHRTSGKWLAADCGSVKPAPQQQ